MSLIQIQAFRMSESKTAKVNDKKTIRAAYSSPKLVQLGHVTTLTQGTRQHGNDVGCAGKNGSIICS